MSILSLVKKIKKWWVTAHKGGYLFFLFGWIVGRNNWKKKKRKEINLSKGIRQNTIVFDFKPLLGFFFGDTLVLADTRSATFSFGNTSSWSFEADVEIHTVNTGGGIVFDAQINVFCDTETKVTALGEVFRQQFKLFDTKTSVQQFQSFFTTDSHVASDLFISSDTKLSHGKTCFGQDRFLIGQLLQHFGGTCKSIPGFPDGAIDDQFLHVDGSVPSFSFYCRHVGGFVKFSGSEEKILAVKCATLG